MATQEHAPRRDMPAITAGAEDCMPAEIIPFNPSRNEEGFFDSSHPNDLRLRNPVVKQELIEDDRTRHGRTQLGIFTFEDGHHLEVVQGQPRRQRSDFAVLIGTALGTSIRGHNWGTMLKLMKEGFPVIMVGPDGGHQRWPKTPNGWLRFMVDLASIDLRNIGRDAHEVLQVTDQSGLYKPGAIANTGESRYGAGIMAFNAQAGRFGREVIWSDTIAACFSKAKPLEAKPKQLWERGKEAVGQVKSLGKNASHMSVRKARHQVHTVNLNPYFLAHVTATVPTLVSGRAGKEAAKINKDIRMHNTHFSEDPWTDVEGWQKIFADYPNVVNAVFPGDHGAIVLPETQEARLNRFRALANELVGNQQDPRKITWENVYMGGRLAVVAA